MTVNSRKNLMPSPVKIGIRPTIDGRRNGIRESLEEQTMGMAKAAAKLISENVRHSNGEFVECVIADTTIGGVAEAVACQEKFERENVGLTLTVTPCWCYGTETMDTNPTIPKAVWGFNGTERPGAVYLAAVLAAHSQKGLPAFGIYGKHVQDMNDTSVPDDVKEKILRFARAGLAVATMRSKSYLSVGGVCMGIGGSVIDPDFFQEYLGMRNEYVESVEFLRRIKLNIFDQDEFAKAQKWVAEKCKEGFDNNAEERQFSREEKAEQWEFVIKCYMIMRDLMIGNKKLAEMGYVEESCGHNAIVAGFQGQRQWTDTYPNADFLEALLNSQFDWNGIREAYIVATENDALNGVSMLLTHLLNGTPSVFADVRTFWSSEAVERVTGEKLTGHAANGIIHLINSGAASLDGTGNATDADGKPAMKPFWDLTQEDADACLEGTEWCPANNQYFRGGGFSSRYKNGTKGDIPVTMVRINLVKGLGPVLQLAEGYTCELSRDVHEILEKRTDPTWPTTWFAPKLTGKGAFTDVYSVMASWGANHGAFCQGHVGDDIITLCSMLRIPVNMHNVEDERIFRPSAWNSFGTNDKEGADYRACKNFGPLYK